MSRRKSTQDSAAFDESTSLLAPRRGMAGVVMCSYCERPSVISCERCERQLCETHTPESTMRCLTCEADFAARTRDLVIGPTKDRLIPGARPLSRKTFLIVGSVFGLFPFLLAIAMAFTFPIASALLPLGVALVMFLLMGGAGAGLAALMTHNWPGKLANSAKRGLTAVKRRRFLGERPGQRGLSTTEPLQLPPAIEPLPSLPPGERIEPEK